ncbi:MAG: NRAMP family divalent metal transporter [Synergistes jonesii]|uniref:NRAMP family divalent metal transporter n=1 Tax=Synergistes jonesii TaxID=2754 RepID=UPI00248D8D9E|nr:NRAMP family divalent metal transporter [Synergistes jonesii]MDY2985242.1 NRAMP family divalent metal transporter [Synergistes jonesii]
MTEKKESAASVLIGAAFLMATSAIGPGFLTQTAVFTDKLKAAFAFAIVVSILIDVVVQMNIWRILGVSGKRAQDVANEVFPGLGYFLAILVAIGGLVFNIGNVGGAAMGLNVICGIPFVPGAIVSAIVAIALFLNKEAGKAMDMFTKVLGIIMLAMVSFMVIKTAPPVGLALKETVLPSTIDWLTILTLVGGTVGGYITFAGAHRIIDANITGADNLGKISRGSVTAIGITGIMRYLLFLAILGVVATGAVLDPQNPPASAFRMGAGEIGYRIFGVILWCASVTSVVGASYTSISFLRTLFKQVETKRQYWIIAFICISTAIFSTVGRPVSLLILAGSLNGLILPVSLGTVLFAAYNKKIIGGSYRHPMILTVCGWIMVAFTAWMGVKSLAGIMKLFG